MRPRQAQVALTIRLSACAIACALTGVMLSATPQTAARASTSSTSSKLPDWSGVWVIPFEAFAEESQRARQPGSTTGPQFRLEQPPTLNATRQASGPGCGAPGGMPNVMRFAFGVEFLFTPQRVTMLLEQGPTIRRIFTDGRKHSSDPDLSYAGESIGHWEGQTLVVDTVGITPKALLAPGFNSSGQMHIVERIGLTDRTHLRIDTVVEDPIVLRAPWRYSRIYERSDGSWFERYCDSNRDGNDSEPDLTPPVR